MANSSSSRPSTSYLFTILSAVSCFMPSRSRSSERRYDDSFANDGFFSTYILFTISILQCLKCPASDILSVIRAVEFDGVYGFI